MKETTYYVAMYLRLSRDDADIGDGTAGSNVSVKSESNSISSQREIIRAFISEQNDMELYDVYVDDGFTGSNFERPDFKRMVNDIEAGKVNCVIVKDLSRFGRDYIESGKYIQKSFPAKGVRFIAITDRFDSKTADHSESSIIIPVKNFMNDAYCRDISVKVRSQQKIKMRSGEYIGPFAVYGYRKDENDRHRYIPDELAADVVRNIFELKIKGFSSSAIADRLNNMGILSPLEYKKYHGENFKSGFSCGGMAKWQSATVKRVLTNEVYLGHMVQGKRGTVNYKIKKLVNKPENEWYKVENTHEPIIDEDDFRAVQNLLQSDSRPAAGGESGSLFSCLLFCGHCGEQMIRRVSRYKGQEKIFYICSTYNRSKGCSRHSILESDLTEVVSGESRAYANLFLGQAALMDEISRKEANFDAYLDAVVTRYDRETERLKAEQEKYKRLLSGIDEDLRNGVLSKSEAEKLRKIYSDNSGRLGELINSQEQFIRKIFKQGIAAGTRLEKFKHCLEVKEIDRRTLVNLVRSIFYYGDKRLEITFNFQHEYGIAAEFTQGIKALETEAQAERRVQYA